ncbi:TerB family tellurite resistance protein [Flavobacterium sp. '19STA2R22 D10 B1']|uniref:tellurite resistance TerB family protein n=1 Tax=Flavobacterium aerium TaxID=3037261 RepID=UPI00278C38B1|nr:TerB family tellurite resistance protein [Flavobacterium sp. '19STA2R22 D10 B1']
MSFSDLFDSGFKERNRGHFSAIVRVALADGHINNDERLFLDKLAQRLDISVEEYREILVDPLKYPINAPYLYLQRLERLYDLTKMIYADNNLGPKQNDILKRFSLALGFTPGNVDYIVDKALFLLGLDVDLDTFIFEMQNMNK